MNKTTVFIVFSALGAIGLIFGGILALYKPEGFLTFTSFVGVFLGIIVSAALTINGLSKNAEASRQAADASTQSMEILETVRHNTNGALSLERAKVEALKRAVPAGTDIGRLMREVEYAHARAHYREETH